MTTLAELTAERLREQARLDADRNTAERNQAGQFATPPALAADIVAAIRDHLPAGEPVHLLEPGVGSGAFIAALLQNPPNGGVERMVGVESDPRFAAVAARLWGPKGLRVLASDFTASKPVGLFNLLLANPPYVRHHHLEYEQKRRLQTAASAVIGEPVSGLSGLYVYFILLADTWLAPGGMAAWLIPGEVLDVNYGQAVRAYLSRNVDLLQVHRFDASAVQFDDALVSSAVIIYRKLPPCSQAVRFTHGCSVSAPDGVVAVPRARLLQPGKWGRLLAPTVPRSRLGDLFTIRRGLATGCNEFFILPRAEAESRRLPTEFLDPILPSPRHVPADVIEGTRDGVPKLSPDLVLLNCRLPEHEVASRYPRLWTYLQEGVRDGIPTRYLCSRRTPWYAQEERPPAPFVVPYMGRGRGGETPFRFILNHSRATTANVYLVLYPRGSFASWMRADPRRIHLVHGALRQIGGQAVADGGRVYGGGLLKVEPGELSALPADTITQLIGKSLSPGLFDE
jgi:adenine-specific DNA-methyltransferase